MPTYPLATLAPTVSAAGISIPSYNDILQSLVAEFQAIYGSDIYVAADSQDGQWLAVMASHINNANQAAVAVFQSFSPNYAQGIGLSGLVQLNGLTREIPTNGTVIGSMIGQAGTTVVNGIVQDSSNNQWALPTSVVIPSSGQITVTATALMAGEVLGPAGTINTIYNPQLGWQSFVNTADAVPGAPVESDAELRIRRASSTAISALDTRESIYAAVANVPGAYGVSIYDNDTYLPDVNGVPAHSICVVAAGGSASAIAAAIAGSKPPGVPTYGTTTVTVYDQYGLPDVINFFTLTLQQVYFSVTIHALANYSASTAAAIQAALVAFVNSLPVGAPVYYSQSQAVASLMAIGLGSTFNVSQFYLGTSTGSLAAVDLPIGFASQANCQSVANVSVVVV